MVYATTLSEPQRVIFWRHTLEEFGPNIQYVAGVGNIVADTISRFPSTSFEKNKTITSKD